MVRCARSLALASVALIAGCGGAASPGDTGTALNAPEARQAAAATVMKLKVDLTDGGIGTAARAGRNGLEELPNGPVKDRSSTEQGVGAGASCADTDLAPSKGNLPTVVAATLCLLNGERRDKGLRPLKRNAKLAAAAAGHSQDMVAQRYFDHVAKNGSDPVTRIRRAGYIPRVGAWTVGENLAWGTGALATPKEIVKAWMKSRGHRENILRAQFKEVGLGVVAGNPRSANGAGATYTTTFGAVTGARAAKARRSKKVRRLSRKARARPKGRSVRTARLGRAGPALRLPLG